MNRLASGCAHDNELIRPLDNFFSIEVFVTWSDEKGGRLGSNPVIFADRRLDG